MNSPLPSPSPEQDEALAAYLHMVACQDRATRSDDFRLGLKAAQALTRWMELERMSYPGGFTDLGDPHVSAADLKTKWLDYKETCRCTHFPSRNGCVEKYAAKNRAWGIFLDLAIGFLDSNPNAGASEANP